MIKEGACMSQWTEVTGRLCGVCSCHLCLSSREWTQVTRLHHKHLYLPSHLNSPGPVLSLLLWVFISPKLCTDRIVQFPLSVLNTFVENQLSTNMCLFLGILSYPMGQCVFILGLCRLDNYSYSMYLLKSHSRMSPVLLFWFKTFGFSKSIIILYEF